MTTIDTRIQAGIAWLNERRPGWREDVNPETLQLSNTAQCVLGQVARAINRDASFGSIVDCLHDTDRDPIHPCVLELLSMTRLMTEQEAVALGFEIDNHETYLTLDQAWKEALQ